jgi:glycosyltransferase involved in cell wall biosynthesis
MKVYVEKECMVSIICNAYNQVKYIKDALNGFVMQETSFPFEVLIHDDASTDGTADIIREYEKMYPDIIKPVYQKENQYSKHLGIISKIQKDRAMGKYVAMCEGDDYWTDPHKLQKQFDFMENNPDYTLCGCSTSWLNMLNGKIEKRSQTKHDRDVRLEEFVTPFHGRVFPFVSFFLKTEIWKNMPACGFPVGDIPLTYYAALIGKVRMLSDCMCVYRWHSDGSWTMKKRSRDGRNKIYEKMISGLDKLNTFSKGEYSDVFERGKMRYQYLIALRNRDFQTIRNTELYNIFKERDFLHKFSDILMCIMPQAFRMLSKISGREK